VLAHTGASMFHLACGLRTAEPAALELVDAGGPVTLDVAVIAARVRSHSDGERGGLVILPPDVAYDWDRSLTDTLLSCGFTGVVGWLWPVPDQVAALMLFVLHTYLVDDEAGPAVAVRAVHRWMRAPVGVPDLPPTYAATLGGIAAADPRYWAALCHWGR